MGEFGWAYISGAATPVGINGSVQLKSGTSFSGSSDLVFDASKNLKITGSVLVKGNISASAEISASAFYGDGSNISGITSVVIANDANNRILTADGDSTMSAESNLTFDGSTLTLTGDLSASVNVSASAFYGDGSEVTALNASNISAGTLNNARLPSSISVTNLAGAGASITDLNAGNINAGTLNNARLPQTMSVSAITSSTHISASSFHGDGSNLLGITTSPAGATTQIQYNNAGAFAGSSNLTFDGSTMILTGTLNVSGAINANEYNVNVTNQSVINLTATGSTKFGDTTDDIHQFTGSVRISGGVNFEGLTSVGAVSTKYLALDSSDNLVLTSSSGGGGGGSSLTTASGSTSVGTVSTIKVARGLILTNEGSNTVAISASIGEAEDAGGYTDGLFTDFSSTTPVGTPVDRFNEVLKILAPSPAPNVKSVNEEVIDGRTAKLSFGASNAITDYTSSAGGITGFNAVGRTGTYGHSTSPPSGNGIRLGVYNGTQSVDGKINHDVSLSQTNGQTAFTNFAFGNANEGTLKLELNGTVIHSLDLSTAVGANNPASGTSGSLNSNGSGFTNISVTASTLDGNANEWYIFKYRTANYKVAAADQKVGWNYARVIHSLGSDNQTNYIEWINDPSGAVNDLSVSNARIENVELNGSRYISGVQYNTSATASYKVDINNLYRNVYQASGTPISFTTTANATNPDAQSVEDIGGGEDNTKVLGVTASFTGSNATLFNGTMSCNVTAIHPLKATISNTGAVDITGFLVESRDTASVNLIERFSSENFRKVSGAYDTQASTTASVSLWNSQTHMTGSNVDGHQDGLLFHNERLYSPVDNDIPLNGNFAAMLNVESGQPNYSTVTGNRTFYRVLSNSSGADLFNFKIETTKNATTFNNSALGAGNAHLFVKIPGGTGWMDASQNFVYGNILNGAGALIQEATNDVDSGNNVHNITFGTASVANNDRIMLKIVADESWGGYIEQMQFTMPADQTQQTPPVLSDIDNQLDGETVRVSFGGDNPIAGYSNTPGGNSDIEWADQGASTNRRGAVATSASFTGFLNEDESATSDFPVRTFFNGYSGSLVLQINGTEVHTISLTGTLNQTSSYNSNDSGFIIGPVLYSTSSNIPDYNKPYRTGSFQIGQNDQRSGYNYAKVIHRTSGDQQTNIIEWVVDPSGAIDNTSITDSALGNFGPRPADPIYRQSGIGYFTLHPTASYTCTAHNFYSNVYEKQDAITFVARENTVCTHIRATGSGTQLLEGSNSTSDMPFLSNAADCETTSIDIRGILSYSASAPQISGGFFSAPVPAGGRSLVRHPLKSDRMGTLLTKTGFMKHSGTLGSTNENTEEYFKMERYRVVSGNYATQSEATGSSGTWNSSQLMNAGGTHDDGMVTINGYLISPKQIGNAGDTRNVGDGGSLQAPNGNPNYSSLSNNVRTYYRYFKNNTVNDRSSITVTLYGTGSLVQKSTSLGANNNFYLEAKVPGETGWRDAGKAPVGGENAIDDGSGAQIGGTGTKNIVPGGSSFTVSYGAGASQLGSLNGSKAVVFKISAHEGWTGYINRITVAYS